VSGPLAEWCAVHSKASRVGRAVLGQLALGCNHDGSNVYALTWDELAHRTGWSRRAVAKGLREIEDLAEASPTARRGGGRGLATPYGVNITLCDPIGSCPTCRILAKVLPGKGAPGAPFHPQKGARHDLKGAPGAPTTYTRARTGETASQRLARLAARTTED
jgi:hypothetical protein